MRVAIAGGNSFIGRGLTQRLVAAGDTVVWLSHRPGHVEISGSVTEVAFDPTDTTGAWADSVAEAEAVVNLSGYPIASRWNPRVKGLLRSSRVETTKALVEAIRRARESGAGPNTYVSASGIGVYGDRGDTILTEDTKPGDDWLAALARDWEAEAQRAADVGCRTVILRNAPVLGSEGLIPKLLLPFKMFVGGPIGSGAQWMAWIHYDDVTGLYAKAVRDPALEGTFNACAPGSVTAREFSAALGSALHRPSWLPVPAFALRIVLGEVAPYTLFSQRASAEKAVAAGYIFEHPEIREALRHVTGTNRAG